MVAVESDDDCRERLKLLLLSLSVVGSLYKDTHTTGVAIALQGAGLL